MAAINIIMWCWHIEYNSLMAQYVLYAVICSSEVFDPKDQVPTQHSPTWNT